VCDFSNILPMCRVVPLFFFFVADQFKFKLTSDSKIKMDEVTLIDCVFPF
jgi:hypothetical protein